MTAEDVHRAIARLGREIVLWDDPADPAVLIGVQRRGEVLARRIAAAMAPDDVLFTGRTVRAALQAIAAHGRPSLVRLAVLIDRGHRELPIRADHVGLNLPTARHELVHVRLVEDDDEDCVGLERSDPER